MGQPLSDTSITAFSEELQKNAGVPPQLVEGLKNVLRHPKNLATTSLRSLGRGIAGPFHGTQEGVRRLMNPIEGLRSGWRSMNATTSLGQKAQEAGFESLKDMATKSPDKIQKLLRGGTHHLEESRPLRDIVKGQGPLLQKTKAVAEELSRQGWTGQGTGRLLGKGTKYLPIGEKAQTVGMAGLAIPNIINAEKATPTGQDAGFERGLGELGSNLGFVASGGLGLVPMTGLWYAGMKGGSRLGRIIDRMRAGSGFRDAVSAPSPQEAERQLQTINRYYGDSK